MSNETAKTNKIRDSYFFKTYLIGKVLDIGCGNDPVLPAAEPYDSVYGHPSAEEIAQHRLAESYDCVYSSHCLEHMADVPAALAQWWSLVRPGGYLVLVVPDEALYEQGFWPSRFNPDHKATFRMGGRPGASPRSYEVRELVSCLSGVQVLSIRRQDKGYVHAFRWKPGKKIVPRERLLRLTSGARSFLKETARKNSFFDFFLDRLFGFPVDQTLGKALAQIQIVCQKGVVK